MFPSSRLYDGDIAVKYGSQNGCKFGMTFEKENHVGILSEAKFFFGQNAKMNWNFKLQGSQNGQDWDDIHEFGRSVHEGWNIVTFDDATQPAFKHFRFNGLYNNRCEITEFRLTGVEVINSDANTY